MNFTPDPKKHLIVSITKSILRIIGCTSLIFGSYIICGMFLIAAEILGIVEELL